MLLFVNYVFSILVRLFMIIDHQYRYIYTAIPKTGSISIQFALGYGNNIPEPELYHQDLRTTLSNNMQYYNYFKFAFVRNPWDRLLSLYNDFTVNRVCQYSGLVRFDKPLLSEFIDFNDMCIKLVDSPWFCNIFFRSQWDMLSVNNKLCVDRVGRFESFQHDFDSICHDIGLTNVVIDKLNTSKVKDVRYQQYYTDESRNAIAKLYASDIETWNYEF